MTIIILRSYDNIDDTKSHRGCVLQKRVHDREKEMEADEWDRGERRKN